jgi:hypothetical protein
MITQNSYYNWNIKNGDYFRQNNDYDKLYVQGRKRDNKVKTVLWLGAALVTCLVFLQILVYAAKI